MTDYYKHTHWNQYPDGLEHVYSYIESRGSTLPSGKILFYGLQGFLKNYLSGNFFDVHDELSCQTTLSRIGAPLFNTSGFRYIKENYMGRLPLEIKAVEEGCLYNPGDVLVTIENTDPKLAWLTQWIETMLLRAVWYPTTVATISFEAKVIIDSYCRQQNMCVNQFHLLDFGARGVSSSESAQIGGSAHLVNFDGTDTIEGGIYAEQAYNSKFIGTSAIASEHSVMTMYREDGEEEIFDKLINLAHRRHSPVSIVIDSYDEYKALKKLGPMIKNTGVPIVVRPDSGDPLIHLPAIMEWAQAYDNVKVLWGDGISLEALPGICQAIVDKDLPMNKVMFGMGGKLLQGCTRDTLKFAMKASAIKYSKQISDGHWQPIGKNPKNDPSKASKQGTFSDPRLRTVFLDGNLTRKIDFHQIRENATKDFEAFQNEGR